MSGLICECNEPVKNLGTVNCIDKFGRIWRITFVPIYKEDGSENYIDATATLNKAYFDALQYHTDTNSRYYPMPVDLKNVEMAKGEAVYEEFDDGSKEFVRFGQWSFKALLRNIAPAYIGKINSKKCGKIGVLLISDTYNIGGYEKTKGRLYPLQLADSTLNAMLQFKTGNTNEGGMLAFEFINTILDEKFSWIPASALVSFDLNTQWTGKKDSHIEQVGTGTTTAFTVDIYTDFGTATRKIPVEGLVAADLVLYNVTDSASVTISTCTESTTVPGRYTITFTAQTNTDILRLTLGTTDAGKPYDGSDWQDVQITLQ